MVQSTQLVKMLCISKDLNDLNAYEFFNYITNFHNFKKKTIEWLENWIELNFKFV